jgi:hypothetical protein
MCLKIGLHGHAHIDRQIAAALHFPRSAAVHRRRKKTEKKNAARHTGAIPAGGARRAGAREVERMPIRSSERKHRQEDNLGDIGP